jgi:histone H3/H4
MNKALSVFLPIFVAWGFLSAEERSNGSTYEMEARQISELELSEDRGPAAINQNLLEEAAPVFPDEHSFEKGEFERDWLFRREQVYDNAGLTPTEIAWLNEIDDITDANIDRVIKTNTASNPKSEEEMQEEAHKILQESMDQKEEFIGSERYQYLLQARSMLVEDYRQKTGRDIKVRW